MTIPSAANPLGHGLRSALAQRELLLAAFLTFTDPSAAEVVALSGVDLLFVDWEHGALSAESVQSLVAACDCAGRPAIVRVPRLASEYIGTALDCGARGILVPQIGTLADAASAVAMAMYPPEGVRGYGPRRAARYGLDAETYRARANREVSVIVQIETSGALDAVEQIAALPGIHGVFAGVNDLSEAIARGDREHESVARALARIGSAGVRAGKTVGIGGISDLTRMAELHGQGFNLLMMGADFSLLREATADRVLAATATLRQAAQVETTSSADTG